MDKSKKLLFMHGTHRICGRDAGLLSRGCRVIRGTRPIILSGLLLRRASQ